MTTVRSLSFQRQSVEHLIAHSARHVSEDIISAARQAALTLAWLETRQDLIRAIVDLDKRAPRLAGLLEAFPGSRLEVTEADTDDD